MEKKNRFFYGCFVATVFGAIFWLGVYGCYVLFKIATMP